MADVCHSELQEGLTVALKHMPCHAGRGLWSRWWGLEGIWQRHVLRNGGVLGSAMSPYEDQPGAGGGGGVGDVGGWRWAAGGRCGRRSRPMMNISVETEREALGLNPRAAANIDFVRSMRSGYASPSSTFITMWPPRLSDVAAISKAMWQRLTDPW